MTELPAGIYELLITEGLEARLSALSDGLTADRAKLDRAEAADRIAWHIGREVERAIAGVAEADRTKVGISVARVLIERLSELVGVDRAAAPIEAGATLRAVTETRPDGRPGTVDIPLIPLLDTTLLTNSPGEPTLWSQLRSEIDSADRIDVVMAFIRRSGIAPLLDALQRHCERGRELRVLTTTYTGSTEQAALEQLVQLGADVRVSYDVTTTRLHAKAWVFHRRSGFSTAYVGSSNLTHSAQVTGMEWNLRASQARNPHVIAKFDAVFDSYWASGDYVGFDPDQFQAEQTRAGRTDHGPMVILSPIEIHPLPFQDRLLELLAVSRQHGHHRNLLVAATGTGKTVMAALDYARLRDQLGRSRLLFVAHREEILDQSLATFRHALRDSSFGEKWVGGARPTRFDHVFASIQSLNAAQLEALTPDHFDVVIVDEFHHAAAASYRRVLDHLRPIELLGLTATPERSDGLPVLKWFDDRIAAELRLWDAIDQQYLVPFPYFGVHDGMDLTNVPWRRGVGYDPEALTACYTSSDAWARLVVKEVARRCDVAAMRALGFCVSIDHARFMARNFSRHGIPAVAIWGDTPRDERQAALADLKAGRVSVVFSVDLFNEGVDVPAVDTVLMLRPTESPVLFLQQLGRGLRKARGKPFCTVLDSWEPTVGSFASTAATGLCSAVAAATFTERSRRGSRSCPPAVTWSSTRSQPRWCWPASAAPSPPGSQNGSTSCGPCAATTPCSGSPVSSPNRASTSKTCTPATAAGQITWPPLTNRSSRPARPRHRYAGPSAASSTSTTASASPATATCCPANDRWPPTSGLGIGACSRCWSPR